MDVREIQPQELAAVLRLYGHLHERDTPPPSDGTAEAAWSESMSNPRCRYFGGYEGSDLVSCCTIIVVPNLTRGCRPYALIENVVTHREHRSKGWGKAVLTAALAFAWSQQCYKVMLMTGRKEESVLRFYEGAGFNRHSKQALVAWQ
jgi:GNAT superfamily N-acetyltransferase